MHYIGMLAFRLPIPVCTTGQCRAISAGCYFRLSRSIAFRKWARDEPVAHSVWKPRHGRGIGAMHYIGMHAMRLGAMCHFNPLVVVLSVRSCCSDFVVALRLVFLARDHGETRRPTEAASAIVMGAAIPIMHYTGMAAASFTVFRCGLQTCRTRWTFPLSA